MDFEWDYRKAAANDSKHGVTFEEAAEVFADDYSSTVPDPDHAINEERLIIFGTARTGRHLVVAFTKRDGRIRLISARPMTPSERRAYEH